MLAVALLAAPDTLPKPLLGNAPRTMPSAGVLAAGLPGRPGGICVDLATRAPGGLFVLATFGPDGTPSFSGLPTARHLADDLAVFFAPAFTPWPVRRRDALHSRRRRAAVHLITARRTDLLLLTSAKRITKGRDAGAKPSTAPEFVAVVPESTPRLVVTWPMGWLSDWLMNRGPSWQAAHRASSLPHRSSASEP